jgi:hypothetical protein
MQLEDVFPDVGRHSTHLDTRIHFKKEKLARLIVHEEFYSTWFAISKIRTLMFIGYPTCGCIFDGSTQLHGCIAHLFAKTCAISVHATPPTFSITYLDDL